MKARVVILTALPVELAAVVAHLSDRREVVHPQGTIYECGSFVVSPQAQVGAPSSGTISVAVAEIGAGNASAAAEAERAISWFQPELAVFVGVAGGIKDVRIGDVVFATKIYGYESGKAEADFHPRPEVEASSYKLQQRARAQARKTDWLARIKPPTTSTPKAVPGPIAAGSAVVASHDSALFHLIRSHYGDAIAVEMEGHGFLRALYANQDVHAIVIRGISDLIEGKANADAHGSQELASAHAAAFAFDVIGSYLQPLPQVSSAAIESSGELLMLNGAFLEVESVSESGENVDPPPLHHPRHRCLRALAPATAIQ